MSFKKLISITLGKLGIEIPGICVELGRPQWIYLILVVEDEISAAEVFRRFLSPAVQVVLAERNPTYYGHALSIIQRGLRGELQLPDLILMDSQFDESAERGVDLTRELRDIGYPGWIIGNSSDPHLNNRIVNAGGDASMPFLFSEWMNFTSALPNILRSGRKI